METLYKYFWQCDKCRLQETTIGTHSREPPPSPHNCPEGGSHSWTRINFIQLDDKDI